MRQQVEMLWEHWGKPDIIWYQGGHTGFFARPVQKFIDSAVVASGLVDRVPVRDGSPDADGIDESA